MINTKNVFTFSIWDDTSVVSSCHKSKYSALWVNGLYLLWQLLLLQSDSQHVWQGFAALLIENVIHKWWALWQNLEAKWDAVHIIICNWLLGQRGLAQVQHSDHDQHGLCNKGLRGTAIQWGLEEQPFGLMIFTKVLPFNEVNDNLHFVSFCPEQ